MIRPLSEPKPLDYDHYKRFSVIFYLLRNKMARVGWRWLCPSSIWKARATRVTLVEILGYFSSPGSDKTSTS